MTISYENFIKLSKLIATAKPSGNGEPSNNEKLVLYSNYKQATLGIFYFLKYKYFNFLNEISFYILLGDCNTPKPGKLFYFIIYYPKKQKK